MATFVWLWCRAASSRENRYILEGNPCDRDDTAREEVRKLGGWGSLLLLAFITAVVTVIIIIIRIEYCHLSQAAFQITILLPQSPEFWKDSYVVPCLSSHAFSHDKLQSKEPGLSRVQFVFLKHAVPPHLKPYYLDAAPAFTLPPEDQVSKTGTLASQITVDTLRKIQVFP